MAISIKWLKSRCQLVCSVQTFRTIRSNGLPVSAARNGFQAGADLSGVTFADANAIVKDDINEVTYEGFRLSLAQEINDNWDALVSVSNQTIESDEYSLQTLH